MFEDAHIKNYWQITDEFADKYVYYGLTDVNDGFDNRGIKYFFAHDFKNALKRAEELGIGIYGIEAWADGGYFKAMVHELSDYQECTDPRWYWEAFQHIEERNKKYWYQLKYSASFHVEAERLERFRKERELNLDT